MTLCEGFTYLDSMPNSQTNFNLFMPSSAGEFRKILMETLLKNNFMMDWQHCMTYNIAVTGYGYPVMSTSVLEVLR